jgi:hypothetical protein
MKKRLNIVLTFDTDDDLFDPSMLVDDNVEYSKPTFLSFLKHSKDIRKSIDEILSEYCKYQIPLTWFVRCDNEIAYHYGSALYLVENQMEFLQEELTSSSDIGYHPHLYDIRKNGKRHRNVSELQLCEQFKKNALLFYNRLNGINRIVRIGEAFSCDALSQCISDLGFSVDSSAMPGRYRQDEYRSLDWRGTPDTAYLPSFTDYRRPKIGMEKRHSFIEIPFTMAPLQCSYDAKPYKRYLDFSFHNEYVASQLENLSDDLEYLVIMTHPAGIFPQYEMKKHGLLAFTENNFRKNLVTLLQYCNANNREISFKSISGLIDENIQVIK